MTRVLFFPNQTTVVCRQSASGYFKFLPHCEFCCCVLQSHMALLSPLIYKGMCVAINNISGSQYTSSILQVSPKSMISLIFPRKACHFPRNHGQFWANFKFASSSSARLEYFSTAYRILRCSSATYRSLGNLENTEIIFFVTIFC